MTDFIKAFKLQKGRKAPSARQRFKNGTITSYIPRFGSWLDRLYRIEGEDPGIFWSSAAIDQEIKNNKKDTIYTEYPPHKYGTRVQPRKASNKDLNKSEYNILSRRFKEAQSVLKQPSLSEQDTEENNVTTLINKLKYSWKGNPWLGGGYNPTLEKMFNFLKPVNQLPQYKEFINPSFNPYFKPSKNNKEDN